MNKICPILTKPPNKEFCMGKGCAMVRSVPILTSFSAGAQVYGDSILVCSLNPDFVISTEGGRANESED